MIDDAALPPGIRISIARHARRHPFAYCEGARERGVLHRTIHGGGKSLRPWYNLAVKALIFTVYGHSHLSIRRIDGAAEDVHAQRRCEDTSKGQLSGNSAQRRETRCSRDNQQAAYRAFEISRRIPDLAAQDLSQQLLARGALPPLDGCHDPL